MRKLLRRWAELEPDKFNKDTLALINDPAIETEPVYLMRIQWAVQAAIVSRGWGFELTYFSILDSYNAEIDINEHISFNRPGSNPAEALLAVYLRALEEVRK